MTTKTITICGKNILVIDNAFDFKFVLDTENFANNSYYQHAGSDYSDGRMSTYTGNYNLCSYYTEEDIKGLGLLTKNETIASLVKGRAIKQIKVHLLKPFDVCTPHIDSNLDTLLYYVNAKWDVNYGGHTMFFSDDMTEVGYTSLFTPNRAIWFDGSIPHMGTPPTSAAKYPRLVLAVHFPKE